MGNTVLASALSDARRRRGHRARGRRRTLPYGPPPQRRPSAPHQRRLDGPERDGPPTNGGRRSPADSLEHSKAIHTSRGRSHSPGNHSSHISVRHIRSTKNRVILVSAFVATS